MGLINHYYWFETPVEDPDQPRASCTSSTTATSARCCSSRRPACSTRPTTPSCADRARRVPAGEEAQTYFAEETLEYPLAAGVEPVEGLFPLDEIVSARLDFATLGCARRDHRPDRRQRPRELMATLTAARMAARRPVGAAALRASRLVGGRRGRGVPRRRSATSSSGVAGVDGARRHARSTADAWVPLRSTVTLAVVVSRRQRRRGHRRWPGSRPAPTCRARGSGRVAAALPLVYPSFIGAAALLAAVAPGGPRSTSVVPGVRPSPADHRGVRRRVRRAHAVHLPLRLPARSRPGSASLPPSLEESARLLGAQPDASVPHGGAAADRDARSGPARCSSSSTWSPTSAPSPRCGTAPSASRSSRARCSTATGAGARRCCSASSPCRRGRRAACRPATGARRGRAGEAAAPGAARAVAVAGASPSSRSWRPTPSLGPLSVLGYWAVRGLTGSRGLGATELADLAEPARHRRRSCRSAPPSSPSPRCCRSRTSPPGTAAASAASSTPPSSAASPCPASSWPSRSCSGRCRARLDGRPLPDGADPARRLRGALRRPGDAGVAGGGGRRAAPARRRGPVARGRARAPAAHRRAAAHAARARWPAAGSCCSRR